MTLYLESSSVVKLYVHEPGSDAVRAELDSASVWRRLACAGGQAIWRSVAGVSARGAYEPALNRAARSLRRSLARATRQSATS